MKIDLLGINVNADTKNTILFLIKKQLAESRQIFIVTPYSEMIVAAQKDEKFRRILNSADFALPDGIGILWAAHFLKFSPPAREGDQEGVGGRGRTILKLITSLIAIIVNPKSIRDPIPEKISGKDFIWDLARLAGERGFTIFLLGGYDDTPKLVASALHSKYRNLEIVGTSTGPRDDPNLLNTINNSGADFLFVALGPVAQEKWIYENLPKLRIKLAIGLGGTFDYLTGKRPPAPQIWANLGLEWLWRLTTQPWRIFRISKGIFGLIWYTIKSNG